MASDDLLNIFSKTAEKPLAKDVENMLNETDNLISMTKDTFHKTAEKLKTENQ